MEVGLFTIMVGVDVALWFPGSGALLARIENWFKKRKESQSAEKAKSDAAAQALKLTRNPDLDTNESMGFSIELAGAAEQLGGEYAVTFAVERDSYFGEIEFIAWQADLPKNFIIYKNGYQITDEDDQYNNILDILQKKSLNLEGNFPDDVVGKEASEAAKSAEDNITEHLAGLIAKINDDEKRENIVRNYYKKINRGIENRLQAIQKEQIPVEEELTAAKHVRNKFYIKWLIIVAVVVVVAAAALAMVVIFWPAGIVAGVAAVVAFFGVLAKVGGYLAKVPLLELLVAFGLPTGVIKTSIENKNEKLKIAQEKLKELKEEEAIFKELKGGVVNKESALKKVIQCMSELGKTKAEKDPKNEISWVKGATVAFGMQKIEDLGIGVISKFFTKFSLDPSFNPDWNKLKLLLQDCGITEKGAMEFAKFLKTPEANRLLIQEIDLSGNPVGVRGVKKVAESLDSNFTVTTFNYDISYDFGGKKEMVEQNMQEGIIKNLVINRYLQNPSLDINALEKDNLLLSKAFNCDLSNTANFLEAVKTAATKKLQENFEITAKEFATLHADLQLSYILKQNDKLTEARDCFVKEEMLGAVDALVEAYKLLPLARCNKFVQNARNFPDRVNKILAVMQGEIGKKVFDELSKLELLAREELLKVLVGDKYKAAVEVIVKNKDWRFEDFHAAFQSKPKENTSQKVTAAINESSDKKKKHKEHNGGNEDNLRWAKDKIEEKIEESEEPQENYRGDSKRAVKTK